MPDRMESDLSRTGSPQIRSPAAAAAQVADYYNANTGRFLALGGSGDAAAIHRAIWAPGVDNRSEAFLYLNRLVADAVRPLLQTADDAHLLDLGCGVGGTSTWLANELGAKVTGITLSTTQRDLAEARARSLGLDSLTRFLAADFTDRGSLALLPVAQAAYAIEAFAHVSDPRRFFAMAAERVAPGGRLIICDDFLVSFAAAEDAGARRARYWQQRVSDGWHLHSLLPEQDVISLAAEAGFRLLEKQDHSAHVRSLPPALLTLASQFARLALPGAYWQNLSGGTALQLCLRNGWTRYLSLIWERECSPAG